MVGVGAGHVLEEGQELLVAVPLLAQPGHLPGRDLQRGEQRGGAVTDVVVGALLGVPGLHRQHLLGSVQRLHLGLLVDTQHDRVLRRGEVEPDHVGDLRDQLGVGGELERLRLPRLDAVVLPRLGDRDVADLQPGGEQPARPVRHSQTLRWRRQRGLHDPPRIHRAGPARPVLIDQPGQTTVAVPVAPQVHRRPRHPDQLRDLHVRRPVRGQQHDPGPRRQPGRDRRRPSQPQQLGLVVPAATAVGQHDEPCPIIPRRGKVTSLTRH